MPLPPHQGSDPRRAHGHHDTIGLCPFAILDIGQFAVYVAKILTPRGKPLPIIFGWGSRDFVPDQDTDPHRKVPGELLPHAVGTLRITPGSPGGRNCWCGREVRLPLASSSVLNPGHPRPSREQFEPNLQKGKRDGPYGKGKGKGQQQQKGKGKSNYRPPGGAASYDYVGQRGWSQGYRFTWYSNERRGWFWRWD